MSEELENIIRQVITAFRIGREGEGADAMVRLMDTLLPQLEARPELIGDWEAALMEELMLAQQRGDFIYVADLMEYEFPASAFAGLLSPVAG